MISVRQAVFSNAEDASVLLHMFNSEDASLFWAPDAKKYEGTNSLERTLDEQLGAYRIYFGCQNGVPAVVFVVFNISKSNHRAEIMCYLDPRYRRGILLFSAWVLLAQTLNQAGILRLFVKVFSNNNRSLDLVEGLHFTKIGTLPEYVYDSNGLTFDAIMYTRSTELTDPERKWSSRLRKEPRCLSSL